jgi:hypothetical protein
MLESNSMAAAHSRISVIRKMLRKIKPEFPPAIKPRFETVLTTEITKISKYI